MTQVAPAWRRPQSATELPVLRRERFVLSDRSAPKSDRGCHRPPV